MTNKYTGLAILKCADYIWKNYRFRNVDTLNSFRHLRAHSDSFSFCLYTANIYNKSRGNSYNCCDGDFLSTAF